MIRLYTVCRFIYGFCILVISILETVSIPWSKCFIFYSDVVSYFSSRFSRRNPFFTGQGEGILFF